MRISDWSSDGCSSDLLLQAYLAQLQAAGALDRFLGERADFFAAYLAFVQGGGQADAFAGLNANIFAGYASALTAYYDYLENGGVPSGYAVLSQQAIRDYIPEIGKESGREKVCQYV